MKALIIEDEKSVIDAVGVAFEFRWPDVRIDAAMTGKEGIEMVGKERPDVVILDINLPDMTGFTVLKKIREFSSVPVIILTVRSEDEDVMRGLETGADDYIVKPFNYLTLLARVRAVLRRSEHTPVRDRKQTRLGSRLRIDFLNQRVELDGQTIKLAPVEYRLFLLLARNKNRVVTYERIMQEIWEQNFGGDTENIRIHVRRLRKKLRDKPPNMIVNERGSGYMLHS